MNAKQFRDMIEDLQNKYGGDQSQVNEESSYPEAFGYLKQAIKTAVGELERGNSSRAARSLKDALKKYGHLD